MKKYFICGYIICCLSFFVKAQNVGINASGATPDASAMLDVSATNKGLSIPNVTLTGSSDGVTIANPLTGLLVFNKGTGGGLLANYYYYNSGTPASPNWVLLSNTRKYSTVGTSNISTTANSVATAVAMADMTITFTPQNSTVFLYFSCAGNLSLPASCSDGAGSIIGYFDLYNGATKITGTKCPLGGTDYYGNMSLVWNAVLVYPVTVTPGVSTTLSMRWWRDNGASACTSAAVAIVNNNTGLNVHRTMFILD